MERNRGKCCSQSIILKMFLSPHAFGASPSLSLLCLTVCIHHHSSMGKTWLIDLLSEVSHLGGGM